ncbi:hypothetical protein ACIRQH_19945 [Streptomyces sp. NPDC102279]|uniref:hypothetical protein n=1 Tax=Streptomyces sp. NPDC102279 TaxID=3366153 RepID=UPI0038278593
MATLLKLPTGTDAAELVEALHVAADARDDTAPELATRWRTLANDIGDALDALPKPRQEHTQ